MCVVAPLSMIVLKCVVGKELVDNDNGIVDTMDAKEPMHSLLLFH